MTVLRTLAILFAVVALSPECLAVAGQPGRATKPTFTCVDCSGRLQPALGRLKAAPTAVNTGDPRNRTPGVRLQADQQNAALHARRAVVENPVQVPRRFDRAHVRTSLARRAAHARAQAPGPAPGPTPAPAPAAQTTRPVDLETLIGNLAALDYETRTTAARLIRRAPAAEAVPVLTGAVRSNPDEFVRYRALVLLTAMGDRGTRDLMVSLLRDRNDRLREVAYKWLEQNPDPRLRDTLLAALQSEQAEFVRPALVRALAMLDDDMRVQRALVAESIRGLDFFREAVIEALGRRRAAYAVDTIAGITKLDGPLRQSAILALGRIGGPRAGEVLDALASSPGEDAAAIRAAQCLAGEACAGHIKALSDGAALVGNVGGARAAVAALAEIAGGADALSEEGTAALVSLAGRAPAVRDQVALGFGAVALRRPAAVVAWLNAVPEATRSSALDLLQEGFERLEEEFAEEQFYAAARAAYWKGAEGSPARSVSAEIIERLAF